MFGKLAKDEQKKKKKTPVDQNKRAKTCKVIANIREIGKQKQIF